MGIRGVGGMSNNYEINRFERERWFYRRKHDDDGRGMGRFRDNACPRGTVMKMKNFFRKIVFSEFEEKACWFLLICRGRICKGERLTVRPEERPVHLHIERQGVRLTICPPENWPVVSCGGLWEREREREREREWSLFFPRGTTGPFL